MGRLYLHIGTPKTGTSMIQCFMARNRSLLHKKGYSYPDFGFEFSGIGKNRNAHFLTYRYHNAAGERLYEKEKELQEKGFEKLLKELSQHPSVVLSDEHIWTGYRVMENFWENLNKRLTACGHELKVIVYLRRQDTYIQSYWAQQVKEVSKVSFAKYIEKERYQKSMPDYKKELDEIAAVVGRENIVVRVYEKKQYYGEEGNLIADFLHAVGLELTGEYAGTQDIVNGSIGGEYLEVKRILNRIPQFCGKENFLLSVMQRISEKENASKDYSRAATFTKGQRAVFMQQFEEGNRLVAKEYLNKEDGILFMESVPMDFEVKPYTKEELVLACAELLLAQQEELEDMRSGICHRIYKEGKKAAKKLLRR